MANKFKNPFKRGSGRLFRRGDMGVAAAFAAAVAVLLMAAMYVVARIMSERAYREKWQDYNDCGWA
jgi:hypothetical protein